MSIARLIRQLRRTIGIEPVGLSTYVLPAVGLLAFGMVAGAGIALFFAPMTGEKLREQVGSKLNEYRSRPMLEEGQQAGTHRNNAKQAEPFPRI
jgi:hypothetical protein